MSKYLQHYLIAVQHPDVSGFELLDTLMVRDKLFHLWPSLTPQQQAQVAAADQHLLSHATEVAAELLHVTDLGYEREQRNPLPEQWWWYLDVLSHTPLQSGQPGAPLPVPA